MDLEEKIHSTFASVASALGYSEVHGRIISALVVAGEPLSLEELTRQTKYSPASVSLSLDLLEILGIVRKTKDRGDRKVYARIEGDLIEGLKNALMLKLQKDINGTLAELRAIEPLDSKTRNSLTLVEKEVLRLKEYVRRLSEVEIPKK
jgi:DNA-binding transcriptional regulator GbsR (MarR family)